MAEQWAVPSGAPRSRFAEQAPAPDGGAPEPYAAAPRQVGTASAPYGVADLPWAWSGQDAPAAARPDVRTRGPFPGTEHVDLAATLGGPGYEGRPPRTDALAVLALVAGLLGIIPWVGIAAIALGHVALYRLARDPYVGGRGLALAGTVLGYLTVAMHLVIELLFSTVSSLF
ncbi:MAG: DUF4190 domain-containing protein [Actinomycetaceae bacterium]